LIDRSALLAARGCVTPDEALADAEWGEDFRWLVEDEELPVPLADAVARFVDEHRATFQPPCVAGTLVWVEPASTVNGWAVVWEVDGALSFRGFEQG
jgi:hypothetical protein